MAEANSILGAMSVPFVLEHGIGFEACLLRRDYEGDRQQTTDDRSGQGNVYEQGPRKECILLWYPTETNACK